MSKKEVTFQARAIRLRATARALGERLPPLAAFALLAGCSAVSSERGVDEPTGSLSSEILNRVEIGDYAIRFERIPGPDGDEAILLAETVHSSNPLAALTREHGMLTSLETFLALAPEGSEPHPDLLAAHESEARALGRTGDALAVQVFDVRNLLVEKSFAAECNSGSASGYTSISPFVASEDTRNEILVQNIDIFTCLGSPLHFDTGTTPSGCELFHPNRLMRMSVCNQFEARNSITVFLTFTQQLPFTNPDVLGPGGFKRYTVQPNPPPPGGVIQRRSMAVRSRNATGIGNLNAQQHRGVLGTLP